MTEQQVNELQKIADMFGGEVVDVEEKGGVDFEKPIKGKYNARITKLVRYTGESEKCDGGLYDFWSLNMQIEEDLEGDESNNRYIGKTYSNTVSKYQEDANQGRMNLLNDLFRSKLDVTVEKVEGQTPDDAIESLAPQLVDKIVTVSCWSTKGGKQAVKITKPEIKNVDSDENWS